MDGCTGRCPITQLNSNPVHHPPVEAPFRRDSTSSALPHPARASATSCLSTALRTGQDSQLPLHVEKRLQQSRSLSVSEGLLLESVLAPSYLSVVRCISFMTAIKASTDAKLPLWNRPGGLPSATARYEAHLSNCVKLGSIAWSPCYRLRPKRVFGRRWE